MQRRAWLALACGCLALAGSTLAPMVAAQTPGGLQVLDFKPGLDDLMNIMVQPRHIKLLIAIKQGNWALAAFQADELRAAFRRIGQTIPRYRGQQMDAVVGDLITPRLDDIDKAIKARDAVAFGRSYDDLTVACNGCHVALNHPFLVMKTPDIAGLALYPDQDFHPQK